MRSTLLLGSALALAAALPAGCGPSGEPTARRSPRAALPLQPVGGRVEVGAVSPCGAPVERVARIVNRSASPVTVKAHLSTCACLEATMGGNPTIGPGEEREVVLVVRPIGYGERTIAVEFGDDRGSLGVLEASFAVDPAPFCNPDRATLGPDDRDQVVDVAVFSPDGAPLRVISVEPPVGTVTVAEGERCAVSLSSFEARRAMEAEGIREGGRVIAGPSGAPAGLRVTVLTDHAACPEAHFEFMFPR